MRGAFRAHKKIGDAKYRVKTKRANADMEVRGADPDFNSRGGRHGPEHGLGSVHGAWRWAEATGPQ